MRRSKRMDWLGEYYFLFEMIVVVNRIRSVGVSNFTVEDLKKILKTAKILPAVNQV